MYMNYPIFKKAMELNIYMETIVKNFSRFHKYSIGQELRELSRVILYSISKIYYEKDKKESIINLRNKAEELKIIIILAKELKVFNSFKQFEVSSHLAFEIAKQSQSWLGSLK